MVDNNNLCKQHSGLVEKMNSAERNIHELWGKWDSMQKWLITILVSSLGTLILVLIGLFTKAF